MLLDTLLFYRMEEDNPLYVIEKEIVSFASDKANTNDNQKFFKAYSDMINDCISHGFYGNLWHCAIVNFLVNHENAYTIERELKPMADDQLDEMAYHDFEILFGILNMNFDDVPGHDAILDFKKNEELGHKFNKRIRDCIVELAQAVGSCRSPKEMQSLVCDFYKNYGIGKLGLHKAFRIEGGQIIPVTNIAHVKLEDLVGYDYQKKLLCDNTDCFVEGRHANNVLLYGDAGTGKSTSIKAIANQYYDRGLRLIEVYKHQLKDIHSVISQIKNRHYKFIIYMDDLSFENFETEYKYLKAVIEGGLEKKPDNVLIYATSNRKHLVREGFSDRADEDDKHKSDTVQEKLSLSYRFGLQIYFGSPEKRQFNEIVLALKERYGITLDDEYVLAEANKWEMSRGGLSGRLAQQFIDYISEVN